MEEIVSVKTSLEKDPSKRKLKFKVDPMDEVSFDGEYELTEPESLSDDESENDVEDRKNYRNRNTKKPKKVAK